ncbi:MAG: amino acid ABC transporter permease [Oscillospiraceae bacterium]|nr:amino acid ABC transporter permease [Oscillospiraceae bacterium]MBQ5816249.1 amino acid ABC transporter permease [Oscillospiraceae bacterium]
MFDTVLKALLEGFGKSLEIFALTLLGALPLGLIISFGSMSKFAPLKLLTRAVVWVVRGTPLMLQLIIFFYGPGLIFGTNIWGIGSQGRFIAVIVAFVLNYACYFSEIYRGGIEGISRGQYEAGQVLGMSKSQVFFRIVLPQVIKRIIPPMSNEIITLVKDTSLARIIGVYEIIYFGEKFIKSDGIIWPLFFTGVFYLLFSGVLTLLFGYIEKKLSYYKA